MGRRLAVATIGASIGVAVEYLFGLWSTANYAPAELAVSWVIMFILVMITVLWK